jgi:hypothetical protein
VVQNRLVQMLLVASLRCAEGSVSKVVRCVIVRLRPGAVLNLPELSYLQSPSGMTLRRELKWWHCPGVDLYAICFRPSHWCFSSSRVHLPSPFCRPTSFIAQTYAQIGMYASRRYAFRLDLAYAAFLPGVGCSSCNRQSTSR